MYQSDAVASLWYSGVKVLKIFIALHHSLSHGKTSHWKWFVTWSTIASMINLTDKRCVPCEAGAKPLAMQQ
ncbi:MAG: hypothetical protein AAB899_04555, partial [Patescibacteria group bacterium]